MIWRNFFRQETVNFCNVHNAQCRKYEILLQRYCRKPVILPKNLTLNWFDEKILAVNFSFFHTVVHAVFQFWNFTPIWFLSWNQVVVRNFVMKFDVTEILQETDFSTQTLMSRQIYFVKIVLGRPRFCTNSTYISSYKSYINMKTKKKNIYNFSPTKKKKKIVKLIHS